MPEEKRYPSQVDESLVDALIGMAWADRVSFDEIRRRTGWAEADVIALMRRELKPSSFRRWRRRVSGRVTKHRKPLMTRLSQRRSVWNAFD